MWKRKSCWKTKACVSSNRKRRDARRRASSQNGMLRLWPSCSTSALDSERQLQRALILFFGLWMASSSIIVLDDSDIEDLQPITTSVTDPVFCQLCHISLTKQSVEARQAHYEQHFSEDQAGGPSVEGILPETLMSLYYSHLTTPAKQSTRK